MPKITTAAGPTGLGAPPAATTFTREDGVEIPVLPLCYPPGATANYVWTTDANGNGSWQPVTSDGALGALTRVLFTVPGGGGAHAALANEITAVDTTSGSGIVDLPDAPAASTLNAVKQIVLGASNTVTITCQGSDVINKSGGGTTQSLTLTSQGSLLHYNGAGIWTVLSDDLPLSQLQALFATSNNAALTGTPTAPTASPGDTSTQLATDAFVAAAVTAAVQGLSVKPSVQEATAAALPTNTYANGSSGIGATLTGVATGVLTVDGIAVSLNDRVLVKNEAAAANNGIYSCTLAGAAGVAYVLTRATDMNTAAHAPGAFAFTEQGTANASAGFTVMGEGPFTIGTTAINWTQFSSAGQVTPGDASLVLTGTTLETATLDVIASLHPPAASVGMNGQKLINLLAGVATGDGANYGQVLAAEPPWLPSDSGWLAESYDPMLISSTVSFSAGIIYLARVNVRAAISVTNIITYMGAAGTTLTASENYGGLWNSSGTLIAATADQSTAWEANPNTFHTMALASGPYALSAGFYWVGILANGSVTPRFGFYPSQTPGLPNNPALTASTSRFGYYGTAQTSLPAITPASITQIADCFWAGLS